MENKLDSIDKLKNIMGSEEVTDNDVVGGSVYCKL